MVVLLIVLIGFLVPACIVLAFAAYPRQRHKLPPRFDPYPRVEKATKRLRPAAKRFQPMAERFASAVTRSQPAVNRVRGAVENTDNHLRRLYGESVSRGADRPVMPIPVNPANGVGSASPRPSQAPATKPSARPPEAMAPVPAPAPAAPPYRPSKRAPAPLPPTPHQPGKDPASAKRTGVFAQW
ncbi:MAG: hypothetical protein ACRDMV_12195 [Streptosporangiales bacterium]